MFVPRPQPNGEPPPHEEAAQAARSLLASPLALFILCVGTFIAAGLLLGAGSLKASLEFWTSREARLWHLLLSLQPALWVTSLAVAWPEFSRPERTVWPPRESRLRPGLVACTVLALLAASIPLFIQAITGRPLLPETAALDIGMPGFDAKLLATSILGVLAAGAHAFGILCVHAQLIDWRRRGSPEAPEGASPLEEDTRRYLMLRSQLKLFLTCAAAIIGLATLSTGALRTLLNGALGGGKAPEAFPASLATAYGLHFSVLLATIYLPAQRTLYTVGAALADRLVTQSLGPRTRWREWQDEHRAVRVHLGMEDNALDILKDGVAVLAPLMASVSSLLLHG
ncbi:hypothetical protein P2318_00015 [Myxococcaceae bacterium GXIMD 01537]